MASNPQTAFKGGINMKLLEIETSANNTAYHKIIEHHRLAEMFKINYYVLVLGGRFHKHLRKLGVSSVWIGDLIKGYNSIVNNDFVLKYLSMSYITPDLFYKWRWYYKLKYERYYYEMLCKTLKAFEKILEIVNPDMIITEQGGEFYKRVIEDLSKRNKIKFYYYGFSPIPGKVAVYDNIFADNWVVDDIAPSEEDYRLASELIRSIREGRHYIRTIKGSIVRNETFEKAYREYCGFWQYDPLGYNSFKSQCVMFALKNLKKGLRLINYKCMSSCVSSIDELKKIKFFFFPMHLPVESQVTIRGNGWIQQTYLIELIAKSLPHGIEIVTREHPDHVGIIPWRYINLLKDDNISFINPRIPSSHIIEKSLGIITINSTAGFEGIVKRKPVIVIGRTYYRGKGFTFDANTLNEIVEYIDSILAGNIIEYTDKELLEFVAKLSASSWNSPIEFVAKTLKM